MLINFMAYYVKNRTENSTLTFWLEIDGKENYERLLLALPNEMLHDKNLKIRQLPIKITSADNSFFLVKIARMMNKFYSHPRYFKKLGISSIIILGGDDISEYYKKWMILSDLFRIGQYAKCFNTILAGQTIGPFKGIREKAAARFLKNTTIFSRDSITTDYLKEKLKISNSRVHDSADLCFPDLPFSNDENDILVHYKLKKDNYITLVPGGFYSLYTHDKQSYLKAWIQLVEDLLKEPSLTTKKILLLPHVTRPEDDRTIIRLLDQKLRESGNLFNERIYTIDDELLPHQLRHILGNGYFTISSRMHAALSTFQMKKPAIALGHSVKYNGVIGKSVQCPELVVNCSEELIANPESFSGEVMQKIKYIEQNYQAIREHLAQRIPKLKIVAEEQIKTITELTNQ